MRVTESSPKESRPLEEGNSNLRHLYNKYFRDASRYSKVEIISMLVSTTLTAITTVGIMNEWASIAIPLTAAITTRVIALGALGLKYRKIKQGKIEQNPHEKISSTAMNILSFSALSSMLIGLSIKADTVGLKIATGIGAAVKIGLVGLLSRKVYKLSKLPTPEIKV